FGKHRRRHELEEARRQELLRQQAAVLEIQRQQAELARAAEAARLQAEREAAARAEADRMAEQQRREAAYAALIAQGQVAIQKNNFNVSIQIFQSAVSLKQSDEGFRLLALAKAKAAAESQARAAEAVAAHERELRLQQERELEKARVRLEKERERVAAATLAAQKAREQRENAAYQKLLDDAQRFSAQKKYDVTVSTLQTARQLRNSDEVNRLLSQALVAQAQASAALKGESEKRELERRLAEEQERRAKAEGEAKRNRERFDLLMKTAQAEMAQKNYEVAVARYRDAAAIFRTDAVLTGLRQAEQARDQAKAQVAAERTRREEEAKREARVRSLLEQGQKALAAGRHADAVATLRTASQLAPGNVEVLAVLGRAQEAQEQAAAEAAAQAAQSQRRGEEEQRRVRGRQLVEAARRATTAGKFDEAARALDEAAPLLPGDPAVGQARQALDAARRADAART